MTAADRYAELKEVLMDVFPFGELEGKQRDKTSVLARALIAYQMRQDGWSTGTIGSLMNRSHSNIVSLTNKLGEVLSNEDSIYYGYSEDVTVWREFSTRVRQLDEARGKPIRLAGRTRAMTLGEFRAATSDCPDDTPLNMDVVTDGIVLSLKKAKE